uniref:Uncharacterized protein n=1 Tax=Anguilla anguilla TaxID=7936 RepID=A0A0E9SCI1_ANGAN
MSRRVSTCTASVLR